MPTKKRSPWEPSDRLRLAALSRLVHRSWWAQVFPFTPATILRRHRNLVARKWTYTDRRCTGRPVTRTPVKTVILRMARENPGWGHRKASVRTVTVHLLAAKPYRDTSAPVRRQQAPLRAPRRQIEHKTLTVARLRGGWRLPTPI